MCFLGNYDNIIYIKYIFMKNDILWITKKSHRMTKRLDPGTKSTYIGLLLCGSLKEIHTVYTATQEP
jgi:hypothetical protein